MDDNATCETGVEGHLHSMLTPGQRWQLLHEEESKRLVWTAHAVGTSGCMVCSQEMMVQVAESDEAMMELARVAYAATLTIENPVAQEDKLPHPLDEDAVRVQIEGARKFERWHMAAQALADLAHKLPKAKEIQEQWKAEAAIEAARATIFHRTTD